ncbi:hypothetical protein [Thiolapillus sp.]|uniref:hypothetical protein n=1 Tax=Thiolapillus sp. TaxID=2017437 RepID=UPI003AF96939
MLLVISSFSPTWCHAYSMEEWQANGFSRHEAELFERSHFTFDEARQWLKHVIDAGHAVGWRDNGFTIEEAEQWQSVGVLDGHQALALINRGIPWISSSNGAKSAPVPSAIFAAWWRRGLRSGRPEAGMPLAIGLWTGLRSLNMDTTLMTPENGAHWGSIISMIFAS